MEKFVFLAMIGLTALMQKQLVQGQDLNRCDYDASSCSCVTDVGTIYLNSATKDDPYSYTNPQTSDLFQWKPCTDFTVGVVTAGAIQTVTGDQSYDLGLHSLASSSVVNGYAIFSMTTTTSARTSFIKCICGTGDMFIFDQEYPKLTYNFIFTSGACCPTSVPPTTAEPPTKSDASSLSIGSFLVIGFFSLLVVYILLGTIFQVAVRQAEGRNRVPNVTLWSALPSLIRDGFIFTFTLGKRTGYNEI